MINFSEIDNKIANCICQLKKIAPEVTLENILQFKQNPEQYAKLPIETFDVVSSTFELLKEIIRLEEEYVKLFQEISQPPITQDRQKIIIDLKEHMGERRGYLGIIEVILLNLAIEGACLKPLQEVLLNAPKIISDLEQNISKTDHGSAMFNQASVSEYQAFSRASEQLVANQIIWLKARTLKADYDELLIWYKEQIEKRTKAATNIEHVFQYRNFNSLTKNVQIFEAALAKLPVLVEQAGEILKDINLKFNKSKNSSRIDQISDPILLSYTTINKNNLVVGERPRKKKKFSCFC